MLIRRSADMQTENPVRERAGGCALNAPAWGLAGTGPVVRVQGS